jgi:Protein-L-isoaspartate(D-aspartate) O-methyltransferase (PCMT)
VPHKGTPIRSFFARRLTHAVIERILPFASARGLVSKVVVNSGNVVITHVSSVGGWRIWSDFATPEEVNEVYRRRARFFDWLNAYYLIGFRWWAYRRRAVAALQLQPGATVVEIGCGTGLNFGLLQKRIGASGRLLGVDLCADMLKRAG